MAGQSKIDEIKDLLLPYKDKAFPKNVENLYTYIDNRKDCIDYKSYRKKGYFIGSSASESANKYTMQDRMKLQGMRWNKDNAQIFCSANKTLLNIINYPNFLSAPYGTRPPCKGGILPES